MLKYKKELIYSLIIILVFFVFYFRFIYTDSLLRFGEEDIEHIEKCEKFFNVLYVDSYNEEYPPNINIRKGFQENLSCECFNIRTEFLDAKNKTHQELIESSEKIFSIYKKLEPDLVLASDDAAVKYFANRFLRNKDIPVIFTGVNWSCEEYDLPCENITGEIEVELIERLVLEAQKLSNGKKISILTADTETDRKNVEFYKKLGVNFQNIVYVKNIKDWKQNFLKLSNQSDFLFLRNNGNILNWEDKEIKSFVQKNIKIPTVSVSEHMKDISVLSITKDFYSMGRDLADKMYELMIHKKNIRDMKLTKNKKFNIILNMRLANKLNINFPINLIDISELIDD